MTNTATTANTPADPYTLEACQPPTQWVPAFPLPNPCATVCSCGVALAWEHLPSLGIQDGGTENGRRFWCDLRNCPACRTTLAREHSAPTGFDPFAGR